MLAALVDVASSRYGYLGLFFLVAGESSGVPLPGETALIVASVLAADGKLSFPLVIALAAAGAIVGDNIGFMLGRRGVRRLLVRPGGRFAEPRQRLLERGELFFERHGAKTVFIGRWLPVLRVTAAWLAGASRMEWRTFIFWNAAGGIAWAATVGTAAYVVGPRALHLLNTIGLGAVGAVGAVALAAVVWLAWHLLTRSRG